MSHPWLWHRVKPLEVTSTLMITFIPTAWDQVKLDQRADLRCLTEEEIEFSFSHFKGIFSKGVKIESVKDGEN